MSRLCVGQGMFCFISILAAAIPGWLSLWGAGWGAPAPRMGQGDLEGWGVTEHCVPVPLSCASACSHSWETLEERVHGNVLCAGSRELSTASGPFVTQEDRNTDTCTAGPECPSSAHSQSSSLDWQLSFPRARFGCEIFLIFPRASQYSFPVPPV